MRLSCEKGCGCTLDASSAVRNAVGCKPLGGLKSSWTTRGQAGARFFSSLVALNSGSQVQVLSTARKLVATVFETAQGFRNDAWRRHRRLIAPYPASAPTSMSHEGNNIRVSGQMLQ